MYVQMACHAGYGLVSARPIGGNTWDLEDALTAMVAGRCSVEGDAVLAIWLEDMFSG